MKDRWKWPVIALGIAIGGLIVWKAIPRSAADTNIQWKFGNQSLNLNVKKDMSDPQALIQKLMSTPFSKAGTLFYLNKDEGDFNRFEFREVRDMDLYRFSFEKREEEKVIDGINGYALSADGKSIVYNFFIRGRKHFNELEF